MAYIGQSRESYKDGWQQYVCLDKEDVKLLFPEAKRLLVKKNKRLEHYEDIHESGEATSRQETARTNAQDDVDRLSRIIEAFEKL